MSPFGATAMMRAFLSPVAKALTVKPCGAFSAAMRSGVASTLLGFQILILVENMVPSPCWAVAEPNTMHSAAASEARFIGVCLSWSLLSGALREPCAIDRASDSERGMFGNVHCRIQC